MKLKNWTFYKAKQFVKLNESNEILKDIAVLVLRPDINKEKTLLAIGLDKKVVNSLIIDLQNKVFEENELFEIFKENIGFVLTEEISEIDAKGLNLSNPIHPDNIKSIIKIYNLFLNVEPIEFDTKDYQDLETIQNQEDVFTNVDFENIPLPALLQTLNVGMENYKQRVEEIFELDGKESINKKLELVNIQSNLIAFFDQALRKMDEIITKLSEQNAELIKKLESQEK
ncbi:hypothetical protein V2P57_01205 [Mycoplasma mycoides subsp. mycoides]|uniref:Uncharacterized protein n=2 Tax=Mycoplasma mycoides subsp. mycoides TaxID=2103 RepID=Q6MU08_MYCMS|nr:hypothetical protein [Mycoplasma mycoides]CAE76878.1 Hypothetical protein MSC_0236 [Mycoplasma mycoides subsp. mycoides SC str. PG1]ADK69536.1 conserved hypothetical protein [Mycoplasma mycoides subsp. mycoides SC str. Gladysdale]AIZ55090.1 hypothetical protein mycmycITA_00261 [Mycoplasma mycoides subsp. mycoides]AME10442.1 hypothetical protein MmmBen_0257 [Mycoplasma mycoides subsp. mycoides]AME11450.1 hypothetical protein MmmBen50_0253 [Mycoplasma mycoides subsp. mycoides]